MYVCIDNIYIYIYVYIYIYYIYMYVCLYVCVCVGQTLENELLFSLAAEYCL